MSNKGDKRTIETPRDLFDSSINALPIWKSTETCAGVTTVTRLPRWGHIPPTKLDHFQTAPFLIQIAPRETSARLGSGRWTGGPVRAPDRRPRKPCAARLRPPEGPFLDEPAPIVLVPRLSDNLERS